MSDIKKYPWESSAQLAKDPLYAVKSLAKGGHYMIGGTMLREGEWRLNVRGYEVKQKGLLEDHTDCLCVTMEEYHKLMSQEAQEPKKAKDKPKPKPEPEPEPVPEPEPEPELKEETKEPEEAPPEAESEKPQKKKRTRRKKKSEDS